MTALFARLPKSSLKAVASGDSALIMWLSLNLILLVFFMLLNSMATPGTPAHDAEMVPPNDVKADVQTADIVVDTMPIAPFAAWREDIITRLRGTILNRMNLRVLPQATNATELRVELPMAEVFRADGTLRRPEFVARLRTAAGEGSDLAWSLKAPYDTAGDSAARMALLSRMTRTPVAWEESDAAMVEVQIRPALVQGAAVGRNVQDTSEELGGDTVGVDAGGVR